MPNDILRNQKGAMYENKINYSKDLKVVRMFLKKKKITLIALSKEMNYSIRHISRLFNDSQEKIPPRFMNELFNAIEIILKKDLKEFYNL